MGAVLAWALGHLALRSGGDRPAELVVESPLQGALTYPLSVPRVIRVSGAIGVAEIEIAESGARMVQAPCRNKVCINSGWIRRAGEISVCIPNQLVLRLQGAERRPSQVDAISR